MKNIIIQKESKAGVRQWHFDRFQILTFFCIALMIAGVSLFFISDQLSIYLYEKRLKQFKSNYANVSKNHARQSFPVTAEGRPKESQHKAPNALCKTLGMLPDQNFCHIWIIIHMPKSIQNVYKCFKQSKTGRDFR